MNTLNYELYSNLLILSLLFHYSSAVASLEYYFKVNSAAIELVTNESVEYSNSTIAFLMMPFQSHTVFQHGVYSLTFHCTLLQFVYVVFTL